MIKRVAGILSAFFLVMVLAFNVEIVAHAADGRLIIAISSDSVEVGDTVNVTVTAQGPAGARAISQMELEYDTELFTFVSANIAGYTGGAGGTVAGRGTNFTVVLEAIAPGSTRLTVSGTEGRLADSQSTALTNMTAAGAAIRTTGTAASSSGDSTDAPTSNSADNSLSTLSLSAGTLSPAFRYGTTRYTATVPGDISTVEVTAVPTNDAAEIVSITGNENLQDGENTVQVTVRAGNNSTAVYTIVVTREAGTATSGSDTPIADGNATDVENPDISIPVDIADDTEGSDPYDQDASSATVGDASADTFADLQQRYLNERIYSRLIIGVLAFIIIILIVLLLFQHFHHKGDFEEYEDDDEDEGEEEAEDFEDNVQDELEDLKEEVKAEAEEPTKQMPDLDESILKEEASKGAFDEDLEIIDLDD